LLGRHFREEKEYHAAMGRSRFCGLNPLDAEHQSFSK
jgi:hypothetical protein